MVTPLGWEVCNYQTLSQRPSEPALITDLVQFFKYQLSYISQYYTHIKFEIPKAALYQAMKATKKIIMAKDEAAKACKGLLGFVITDSKKRSTYIVVRLDCKPWSSIISNRGKCIPCSSLGSVHDGNTLQGRSQQINSHQQTDNFLPR